MTHTVRPGQIYESCHTGHRILVVTVHDQPAHWGTATVQPLTGRPRQPRHIPVRYLNPVGARTGYHLTTDTA